MTDELKLVEEIEQLKADTQDTRLLYKQVCRLLFFSYGITPTGNKLYQYVRRGSMSVPVEELANFWAELRDKARIEVEHPSVHAVVKGAALEMISAICRHATDAAAAQFKAFELELQEKSDRVRVDLEGLAEQARQAQSAAESRVAERDTTITSLREQLTVAEADRISLSQQLEAKQRELAGAHGRIHELQVRLDQTVEQQRQQQEVFSVDLRAAQERAAASERRALVEIDNERQARARADKVADDLRNRLGQVEARERQQALNHAEASTRSLIELQSKDQALNLAVEAQRTLQDEVDNLRSQLASSQQAVASHQAEANTLKQLVDRLTLAPVDSSETRARPARRKAPGT